MTDLDKLAKQLEVWRSIAGLLEDNFTSVKAARVTNDNAPYVLVYLDMPSGALDYNERIALRDLFLHWLVISLEDKECMAELARSYQDKTQEELVQSMISVVIGKERT